MRLLTRLWILRVLSLFVIFVVGLALFGATAQMAHAVAAPTLTLSHSSGPPTTTVNVNGSGFGAQETIVYL